MPNSTPLQQPKPLEVLWKINRICNFNCAYCFDSPDVRANPANRCSPLATSNLSALASAFNTLPPDSHIVITGGEPFLHPNFTHLCQILSSRHRISLATNLSSPATLTFADTLSPARVPGIRCSLHLAERERLNLMTDFRDKLLYIRNRGFNAYITEVLSPATLPRLLPLANEFNTMGFVVWPILLRGLWQGRRYPAAYTRSEREQIRRFSRQLPHDKACLFNGYLESSCGLDFLGGEPSFRHLPCRAGMDSLYIQPDGKVYRCPATRTSHGNLYAGTVHRNTSPLPCPALVCTCPWYGYLMTSATPRIYSRYHLGFRLRQHLNTVIRQPAGPFSRASRVAVKTVESRFNLKLWPQG